MKRAERIQAGDVMRVAQASVARALETDRMIEIGDGQQDAVSGGLAKGPAQPLQGPTVGLLPFPGPELELA